MSYLARLARPAAATERVAASLVGGSNRESFGEEHREVEVSVPIAPPPADSPIDRSMAVPPSTQRDRPAALDPRPMQIVAAPMEGPPAGPRSRAVGIRKISPPAAVEPQAAPVVGVRREPVIASLSPAAKPLPARGGAIESEPVGPAQANVSATVAAVPPAPPSRPVQARLRTERITPPAAAHDEPAPPGARPQASSRSTPLSAAATEGKDKALRTAAVPSRPDRQAVHVHIGAIALTVKAPAATAPAVALTPHVATPVTPPAAAAAPRSRDGLAFSASRHYLRWS